MLLGAIQAAVAHRKTGPGDDGDAALSAIRARPAEHLAEFDDRLPSGRHRLRIVGLATYPWPASQTPGRPSHNDGDRRTPHNSCDSPTRCATARQGV